MPTLLLALATALPFALAAFWAGHRLGGAKGSAALAEARRAQEAEAQGLRTQLALARQAEEHLRGQWEAQEREDEELRRRCDRLAEENGAQGKALEAALTKIAERDGQLEKQHQEAEASRMQRDEAQRRLTEQATQLGEAARLKENLLECQEALQARDGAMADLQRVAADARNRVVELETSAKKDREALEAERRAFEENRLLFRQEFENLANQIFESKHQAFDAQSKEGLTGLLAPFREQVEVFRQRVEQVHSENLQGRATLQGELAHLRDLNRQITEEASNLTRALKGDKKLQGNWGEQKVELLLERSGLRRGIEYGREQNFKDEEGKNLRPDFVVNLPEGKHIIIDSKVSLVDYAEYVAAESSEERQVRLAAHVAALRNHIKTLSAKRYPDLPGIDAPDFTFLFVAIEPAYLAAVEQCPSLIQEANDSRIALVTATTLLPVLRIAANLWSLQRQNHSTQILADQAGRVYEKLRVFIEKMEKLGTQLETAQRTYRESFDTLKDGRGSLVKIVDKFVDLGVKASKRLPTSLTGGAQPELECAEAPEEP